MADQICEWSRRFHKAILPNSACYREINLVSSVNGSSENNLVPADAVGVIFLDGVLQSRAILLQGRAL